MLQNIFFGLSLGAVYSLIAVGFALVFNILKFSNFSHGGVMSFTAYAGYLAYIFLFNGKIAGGTMFIAVVLVAALVGAITAIGIERVGFRRLRRNQAPVIYYFISSITLGILLENIITIFASSNFYSYRLPISLPCCSPASPSASCCSCCTAPSSALAYAPFPSTSIPPA